MASHDVPGWFVDILNRLPAEWGLLGLVAWLLYRNKPEKLPPGVTIDARLATIEKTLIDQDKRISRLQWEMEKKE